MGGILSQLALPARLPAINVLAVRNTVLLVDQVGDGFPGYF